MTLCFSSVWVCCRLKVTFAPHSQCAARLPARFPTPCPFPDRLPNSSFPDALPISQGPARFPTRCPFPNALPDSQRAARFPSRCPSPNAPPVSLRVCMCVISVYSLPLGSERTLTDDLLGGRWFIWITEWRRRIPWTTFTSTARTTRLKPSRSTRTRYPPNYCYDVVRWTVALTCVWGDDALRQRAAYEDFLAYAHSCNTETADQQYSCIDCNISNLIYMIVFLRLNRVILNVCWSYRVFLHLVLSNLEGNPMRKSSPQGWPQKALVFFPGFLTGPNLSL